MNTNTKLIVNSTARRIAFVMVCLLIASVGLVAKITINQLDRAQDATICELMQPVEVYLHSVAATETTAVDGAKITTDVEGKKVVQPAALLN